MKISQLNNPRTTLSHARTTVAFTGAAGNGAAGTVTVFTISGRVRIETLTAFCTETLVGAATLELGVSGNTAVIIAQVADATTIAANDWWVDATVAEVGYAAQATGQKAFNLSSNVIATVGATNITDGTIIFDVWYYPITDGASLS